MDLPKVKRLLLDLVHQVRIGVNPSHTFEQLDKLGVTFRAQNEVCSLAENIRTPGHDIVNEVIQRDYLFRYPDGVETEYIEGYGVVSQEFKEMMRL